MCLLATGYVGVQITPTGCIDSTYPPEYVYREAGLPQQQCWCVGASCWAVRHRVADGQIHCCFIESHSTVIFQFILTCNIIDQSFGSRHCDGILCLRNVIHPRNLRACMRPTNASFSPPWRNPSFNTRYMFKRACVYTWLESQKYLTLAYIQ